MRTKASWRSWAVAADDSISGFRFAPKNSRTEVRPGERVPQRFDVRVVVEVRRAMGGLMPRALLGAEFIGSPESHDTEVVVNHSGASTLSIHSATGLMERSLHVGLPEEFADAVIKGLVRKPLPRGRLTVVSGGFDPVESSNFAFEHAGRLLADLLLVRVRGGPPRGDVSALRTLMGSPTTSSPHSTHTAT